MAWSILCRIQPRFQGKLRKFISQVWQSCLMLKNNSCLSQVFFIRYKFPLLFFPLAILVEGCSFISDLCSWKSKNNGWTLSSSDKGLYCWLCNIHVHKPLVSTSIQCNGTWMQPQQSKVAYRRMREHSTIYDLKGAYYFGICVSKLLLCTVWTI